MTESQIKITTPSKGIACLTLNRPEKRNALSGDMINEWLQALQKIAADKTIRVLMLAGNGEHFCAGADIAWMQKMAAGSYQANVVDALQLATLLSTLNTFPKPTIALVQGAIMGGGLGVIACCDIVIAAENANFCFSEVKMGLTPSVISPYVVPIIGQRAARYYFLTAEKFTAKRAEELELVQRVVSLEKLSAEGFVLAEVLLKQSPNALSEAKKLIRHVAYTKLSDELIQFTSEHLATMRSSDDAREGLKAFLEKRAPIWE
ncbi:MAG: enoyl-CoA hydratase-related protein [Gammaproteobacteria bacterium]